jgi:SanA protein
MHSHFRLSSMKRIITTLGKIILSVSLILLIVFLVVNSYSYPYIHESLETLPQAKTVIILGASILPDKTLSPILQERVNMAVEIYKRKIVENILVTGDDGSLFYNEVTPIHAYLISKGIPDGDIYLDHAGFDTYSSMYRARDIFLTNSVIIVSQSFHLPRAIFIARNLGLPAYGMNADIGRHYLARNYIREIFASVKAVFDLATMRKPKYLGSEIPIPVN